MRSRAELARVLLADAGGGVERNVANVGLSEALSTAGSYRSIVGVLKHIAGWSHVYYSYAFEPQPKHWRLQAWPRGLRDTIDPSADYFAELIDWQKQARSAWEEAIAGLPDETFDEPHPLHFGVSMPLFDVVVLVANHWNYHAGEINQILATVRGESWELGEEVEENHVSTRGHRVRPPWMNDEQVKQYEAYIALRDRELYPER
ncbi:MAG TPA: DinB family protein [Dehalococcoidia bacterium]|jgi:uncharacterized damage-inducible protein DinB